MNPAANLALGHLGCRQEISRCLNHLWHPCSCATSHKAIWNGGGWSAILSSQVVGRSGMLLELLPSILAAGRKASDPYDPLWEPGGMSRAKCLINKQCFCVASKLETPSGDCGAEEGGEGKGKYATVLRWSNGQACFQSCCRAPLLQVGSRETPRSLAET